MAIKGLSSGQKLRNNKLIYAIIAVLCAVVFVGSLNLINNFYQTETYYVLNTDVPTRTQVTEEMLSPVTTSKDSSPKSAKTIGDVQAGSLFTKYPLRVGDILTESNVGAFEDIASGVPDSWVVTSFGVSADNAVGGRIERGDYFDFMVATANGSYYPFVNMLALDTSVSLNNASSNQAADSQEAKAGQTSQYTVAGTPENVAKLQQIMKKSGADVRLVLSPRQNQYAPPALAEYSDNGSMFNFNPSDGPQNLGEGTDNSFTAVKRDAFGRPVGTTENCSKGNGRVDPSVCASANGG